MTGDSDTPASLLALADWRRQMATLYAQARRLADSDPAVALDHWRRVREHLYRAHPQSPIPPDRRTAFDARHFPHDPALHLEVALLADDTRRRTPLALPISRGGGDGAAMRFWRMGWIAVPLAGGLQGLVVFWMEGYAGGLFLPFRDTTNGTETHRIAYHPSCAVDPGWVCPLASTENWLDIPVGAGERTQ